MEPDPHQMNEVIISDDKSKLDIEMIYRFLTTSYWAKGRTVQEVKKSIEHTHCFGVYLGDLQIGFARILSDFITIAYLMDVFILQEYRRKGYSKLLLKRIFKDDKYQQVKKWLLATQDAHSLYANFGFEKIKNADRLMEKLMPKKLAN
jgi:N-acetylglutamate synthase-like GNAT family acetyltransferase